MTDPDGLPWFGSFLVQSEYSYLLFSSHLNGRQHDLLLFLQLIPCTSSSFSSSSDHQRVCMPADLSATSRSLSSHRLAALLWSWACMDGRQRKQLLKYMPPNPSSSGATAQYTVVAAPCCCGQTHRERNMNSTVCPQEGISSLQEETKHREPTRTSRCSVLCETLTPTHGTGQKRQKDSDNTEKDLSAVSFIPLQLVMTGSQDEHHPF